LRFRPLDGLCWPVNPYALARNRPFLPWRRPPTLFAKGQYAYAPIALDELEKFYTKRRTT
jgi:hypothetical protein